MNRGFGIVGTGVMAALHAAAMATLPGARLAAVTDVAAGAAAAFAAARGCAAEPTLDILLARADVAQAGRFGGFSGPEGFARASRSPEIDPERTGHLLALTASRPDPPRSGREP